MNAGDSFILRILCPMTFDCNSCCNMLSQYLLNVYGNSDQAFGNLYKSVINTRTNRSCFTLCNYVHKIMYITCSLSYGLKIFVLYCFTVN